MYSDTRSSNPKNWLLESPSTEPEKVLLDNPQAMMGGQGNQDPRLQAILNMMRRIQQPSQGIQLPPPAQDVFQDRWW